MLRARPARVPGCRSAHRRLPASRRCRPSTGRSVACSSGAWHGVFLVARGVRGVAYRDRSGSRGVMAGRASVLEAASFDGAVLGDPGERPQSVSARHASTGVSRFALVVPGPAAERTGHPRDVVEVERPPENGPGEHRGANGPPLVLGGVAAVAENRALCALGRCRAVRGNGDQEPKPARAYTTTAGNDARGARRNATRPRHRGGARDDPLPGHPCPGVAMTPGPTRDRNTPESRSAGSRTSKPSGTTSRKCHSKKHIPLILKSSGANPETRLRYPERPRSGP